MCGIVGFFRPGARIEEGPARRRLQAAADLLRHRGPDACGVVLKAEQGIGFAHTRLSIIDLDPRANQPMSSPDGGQLITFNGEIYNYRELREELRARGFAFGTGSDTEVLLHGVRAWGLEGLLERAAGMFAFALYEKDTNTFTLARDRAGKKPLYYSESPEGVEFCSELRGLLSLSDAPKEIDPAGLGAYLSLKFSPSPRSLFRGIQKIPPGAYLQKKGTGRTRVRRYWHPYFTRLKSPESPAACLERLATAFSKSVERRLVSDVPVCLFLSGGIDSSLIASALAEQGSRDVATYSIGYKGFEGCNEFEYSRLMAKRLGVRTEEIYLDSREALSTLESLEPALDEPVSDWIWVPLYHLSRRARADGFKVAMVGEGADELFFGYDSMMKGLKSLRRFSSPWARSAAKGASWLLSPVYRYARRGHGTYDLLRRAGGGGPVYMGSSLGWHESQWAQVAGPRLRDNHGEGRAFIESLYAGFKTLAPRPDDDVNLISYIEFYSKMSEVLLSRVDRVSMLASLEARAPFLDHELIELAFSIPGEWKLPGGRLKGLLKEYARSRLPREILERPKMGFSFPFKEWLRMDLGLAVERVFEDSRLIKDGWLNGSFCRRLLSEHRGGWVDHAPRLWTLFDLCRWYDRWAV